MDGVGVLSSLVGLIQALLDGTLLIFGMNFPREISHKTNGIPPMNVCNKAHETQTLGADLILMLFMLLFIYFSRSTFLSVSLCAT